MASFVKLQKDIDGQRFNLIIQEAEGGLRFEVESDDNDLMIEGLSKTLSTKAAVEALHVLTYTQPCLSDKKIKVQVSNSMELSIKAAWISVFELSQQCIEDYRKDVIEYLDGRGIHDLEEVIRYAYCSDEMVRGKAMNKLESFKFETAEQKAKIYDLCVDMQIKPFFKNAPLESETLTETERFWTKYCLQAIKRIPTIVYLRPPLPTLGIERVVAQVGGIANVALFETYENLNVNDVMQALVCQKKGAESWYEKVRVMRVWGNEDVDQVISIKSETFQKALTEKVSRPDYILRKGLSAEIRERWEEWRINFLHHYIPLDVTSLPNSPVRNELNGVIDSFLADDKKRTFLLQGDSGSGKTSFARYLEWRLIEEDSDYLPIYIALKPDNCRKLEELIKNKVKDYDKDHLKRHKKEQKLLFILDGYDETQQFYNLFSENDFQDWKQVKVLFTCRSQYLTRLETYRDQFVACNLSGPLSPSTFEEWYLASFDLMQRDKCIDSRLLVLNTGWSKEEYLNAFESAPRLKEIVANPFVLTIALEVLPEFVQANSIDRIDRATLFRSFVKRRFRTNIQKPKSSQITEKQMFKYSTGLASYLFNSSKLPFGAEDIRTFEKERVKNQILPEELFQDLPPEKLLRIGCPLRKLGDNQFEFLHRSLYDYFVAVEMYETIKTENSQPLSTHFLSSDMAIVDFIVEMFLQLENESAQEAIKKNLFGLISASKNCVLVKDDNEDDVNNGNIKASSNAATILARAGIPFTDINSGDLNGVVIKNASLQGGLFHHVDFRNSDLSGSNLTYTQLVHTDLRGASLRGVEFGEKAFYISKKEITSMDRHPTRTECVLGLHEGSIEFVNYKSLEQIRIFHKTENNNSVEAIKYNTVGDKIIWCGGTVVYQLDLDFDNLNKPQNFRGHKSEVNCISYCYDDLYIASGGRDNIVRLWSVQSGDCLGFKHESCINSITFCKQGGFGISGDNNGEIRFWRYPQGVNQMKRSTTVVKPRNIKIQERVESICLLSEGTQLLIGTNKGKIILKSFLDSNFKKEFSGHEGPVKSIHVNNSSTHFVTGGCGDGTVRHWDLANGIQTHLFQGHNAWITGVSSDFDDNWVLSVSPDNTLRQWGVSYQQNESHRITRQGSIHCVAVSSNGDRFVSADSHGNIILWKRTGELIKKIPNAHEGVIWCLDYHPSEDRFVSGGRDGAVNVWNGLTCTKVFSKILKDTSINLLKYSPSGNKIAFTSHSFDDQDQFFMEDPKAGNNVYHRVLEKEEITALEFQDEDRCILGTKSGKLFSMNTKENKIRLLAIHNDGKVLQGIKSLTHGRNKGMLVIGTTDTKVFQYCLEMEEFVNDLYGFKGHEGKILSLSYQPGVGDYFLASSSYDRTIRVWRDEMLYLQCISTLEGHQNPVHSVKWLGQNSLVSGSEDGTVAVWKCLDDLDYYNRSTRRWAMTWRSGTTFLAANNCKIDDNTRFDSNENRMLIEQRCHNPLAKNLVISSWGADRIESE